MARTLAALEGTPERAIFGLPHNYFKPKDKAVKGSTNYKVDVSPDGFERRASPLFLHIHRFDQGPPVALWLFLPAQFLPATAGTNPEGDHALGEGVRGALAIMA
jgi:hypothetical protein